MTEGNANHVIPPYYHLPVICRSLVDLCGSSGSSKSHIYQFVEYTYIQFTSPFTPRKKYNNIEKYSNSTLVVKEFIELKVPSRDSQGDNWKAMSSNQSICFEGKASGRNSTGHSFVNRSYGFLLLLNMTSSFRVRRYSFLILYVHQRWMSLQAYFFLFSRLPMFSLTLFESIFSSILSARSSQYFLCLINLVMSWIRLFVSDAFIVFAVKWFFPWKILRKLHFKFV